MHIMQVCYKISQVTVGFLYAGDFSSWWAGQWENGAGTYSTNKTIFLWK